MNKTDFKSAYGRIALSDEFKRAAKEKLRAAAAVTPSEKAAEDATDYGEPAKEIKVANSRRKPWKAAIWAGSAVAAIALIAFGASYLIRNGGDIVSTPTDAETGEASVTDEATYDNDGFYGIKEYVVGTVGFAGELAGQEMTGAYSASEPEPLEISDISEGRQWVENGTLAGLSLREDGCKKRGDAWWLEFFDGADKRVIVSVSEDAPAAESYEYITLPNGLIMKPAFGESEVYSNAQLLSKESFLAANTLTPKYVEAFFGELHLEGKTYHNINWLVTSPYNGKKEYFSVNAEGLTEDEAANVFAQIVYGTDEMPTCFGNGAYDSIPDRVTVKTSYGEIVFSGAAQREDAFIPTNYDVLEEEGDEADTIGLEPDHLKLPFEGEILSQKTVKIGHIGKEARFMSYRVVIGDSADKSITIDVIVGDYDMRGGGYCPMSKYGPFTFQGNSTVSAASDEGVYYAEWLDHYSEGFGDPIIYNLTTKNISIEEFSHILAQLVSGNVNVMSDEEKTVSTEYGDIIVNEFTDGANHGAIPTVMPDGIGRNSDYELYDGRYFAESDIFERVEMPFELNGTDVTYYATYDLTGGVDPDELDLESARAYNEDLGFFTSDKCPYFEGKTAQYREFSVDYIGDEKNITVSVVEGDPDMRMYGPRGRGLVFNTQFETTRNSDGLYFAYWAENEWRCAAFRDLDTNRYFFFESAGVEFTELADVVNSFYTDDPDAPLPEGTVSYDKQYGAAKVSYGALDKEKAVSPDDGYESFDTTYNAAIYAMNLSNFEGIKSVGNIAEDEQYEMDDGGTGFFWVLEMRDCTLDAAGSRYLKDGGDYVSLRYEGEDTEFYINYADEAHLKDARYVTDGEGNRYVVPATEPNSIVLSEVNALSNNFMIDPMDSMYFGGVTVNGESYFCAYRRTDSLPDKSHYLVISAKGCTVSDFTRMVLRVVQTYSNHIDETENETQEVQTANGAVVMNKWMYLGTGGGYIAHVSSNYYIGSYTTEDIAEFAGSEVFADPFAAVPSLSELGYESAGYSYQANYAEFSDPENNDRFRMGEPLVGETEDEAFLEAQKHRDFSGFTNDNLEYFKNKTPTMRSFTVSFYSGTRGEGPTISMKALKGNYAERYLGEGFAVLPAEPSYEFCSDYTSQHIAEIADTGELSYVYFSNVGGGGIDNYFAAFYKNGTYFNITASNSLPLEEFAAIVAAVYTS